MKDDRTQAYLRMKREKRINGILFGILAGLGYSLLIWGVDGFLLRQASADYPWLKLALGAPICMLVGAMAGGLTARFDNSLIGFLAWLLAGLGFVWVSSHIPFEGLSITFGFLEPDLRGLNIYPFVESARARMSLLYLSVGILTAIAGAFELFIVEAATRASSIATRWLVLFTCMFMFGPIGLLTDNLINQPLRIPILTVHKLIQDGRYAQVHPVSKEKSRQMGLSALRSFSEIINKPYTLRLGSYDPESLSETTVYVNFDGIWGNCFVITNIATFCQVSSAQYLKRMACLMETGNESECWITATPEGREQLDSMKGQLGKKQSAQILNQRGTSVLTIFTGEGQQQYQCNLQSVGVIVIDACFPLKEKSVEVLSPEQGALRLPLETSFRSGEPASAPQKSPLLPSAQAELPALLGAPQYTIELNIDFGKHSFSGHSKVNYTNTEAIALEQLCFRLLPNGKGGFGDGTLAVTQVLLDGQAVEAEKSRGDTVLKIGLPRALEPGRSVQLDFEFNGAVPPGFGDEANPSGYGIYTYSGGILALSGWYPILAVYDSEGWNLDFPSELGDSTFSDIAFYGVDITVPIDFQVIATGVQIDRQVSGNNVRLRFESGPARDFFIVASPNFKVSSQTVDGTTINSYFIPGHESGGEIAASAASESLRIYNQKYGPYPYTELDVVDAPMRNALGVEFPGIVLISSALYDEPDKPEFNVTIAHEVAHQWWYNVVGNDVFEEPWLDEALATYSSSFFYEFRTGGGVPEPLIQYWLGRYDKLKQDGEDDIITEGLTHFESLANPRVYGGVVYVKGALFLKALREEIGDQAFFSALQSYYQMYKYQIGTTEALLNAFEKAAGRQLDDFYQKWLYSKGP